MTRLAVVLAAAGAAVAIEFEVKPAQGEFGLQERARAQVVIRNLGPKTVDLPDPQGRSSQPSYTLKGPAFPQGRSFDHADPEGFAVVARPEPDEQRVRIEAGASWTGVVTLAPVLTEAGEYELSSRLAVAGSAAQSKTERFRVSTVLPFFADVGYGLSSEGKAEGELGFLHRTDGEVLLYAQEFDEARPDIEEMKIYPPDLRAKLPKHAAEVRVPRGNGGYLEELGRWLIWREGKTVVASGPKSGRVDLEAPPAALVRPALRPFGESAEVLALHEGGRALDLVRFVPPAVAWTAPLPADAKSVVAALGRKGKGNVRHVAFAAETASGIAIFHSWYTREDGLAPFESKRFEPARKPGDKTPPPRLLPGAVPALHVDAGDCAWASFLAVDNDGGAVRLEARFAPGVNDDVTATRFGAAASAGTLLYAGAPDGSIARREAVVRLATGALARWTGGSLQPLGLQAATTDPVLLVPGKEATYIVYTDPARGPYLEPIF